MNNLRKFWLVLISCVVGMAVIACSCGSLIPTPTPTATPVPLPTATLAPVPTVISEPDPSLAGYWLDSETNDVHTIEWQNGKYVVSFSASPDDTLTITDQSWTNGTLSWTYAVQSTGVSVTFSTNSASSDSLYTNWSNTNGNSGTETLQRVSSPVPPAQAVATMPQVLNSMAGRWNDPDTTGTVTTIIAVDGGGYAVQSVINPNRGGNELTATNWANGVLTWTYCIPGGNCLTSVTTGVDATSLYTNWSDDRGYSGQTTFERLP